MHASHAPYCALQTFLNCTMNLLDIRAFKIVSNQLALSQKFASLSKRRRNYVSNMLAANPLNTRIISGLNGFEG